MGSVIIPVPLRTLAGDRLRRLTVALRAGLPRFLGGTADAGYAHPRTLARRQQDYLRSRLARLHKKPQRYRLADIRRLDRGNDLPVWELTLEGPPGVTHRSGDTILVRWSNPPDLVQRVLAQLQEDGNRRILFTTRSSVFQPGRVRYLPLREILTHHLELYVASPQLLDHLGVSRETAGAVVPGRGLSLEELLRGTTTLTATDLIRLQPQNTARAYSVSRIERSVPGTGSRRERVQILVSAVSTPIRGIDGTLLPRDGRATAYFRRHWDDRKSSVRREPAELQVWSLRHPWRLTEEVADGTRPLIMIVTGTGIAGVLCHLRELQTRRQVPEEPRWLIYGVRTWPDRGLYPDELADHLRDGRITRLDIAESRPQSQTRGRRVTDMVLEEQTEIARLLATGADLYVSGTRAMGTAVRTRIVRILVDHGMAADAEEARRVLAKWEQIGRLQVSVS